MYDYSIKGLIARTPSELVQGGIGDALIGALIIGLLYRVRLRLSAVLLGSTIVVATGIYVATRYVHPSIDYQYFKAIASLVPAAGVGFGVLFGEAITQRDASTVIPDRRQRRHIPYAIWTGSIVVTLAVTVASISYAIDYKRGGSVVPVSYVDLANSSKAQAIFNEYNVVAPNSLNTYALGAEVNLNWIGRYSGRPSTRMAARAERPLALLIPETLCRSFECLKGLRPDSVILREGGIALVRLGTDSESLTQLHEDAWLGWITTRFEALGGHDLLELTPSPQAVN